MSLSLAQLRAEFASRGIRPAKRLGQSFMIDPNLARAVARASGAAKGTLVLEIGAGAGHLTEALLGLGAAVVAVEKDPRLHELVRERLGEPGADGTIASKIEDLMRTGGKRPKFICGDALGDGDRLHPVVRGMIKKELDARGLDSFVVASNLPYNIAATFLIALAWSDLPWKQGAVTVQREVAERLAAKSGTKVYGASSVLWQLAARGRIERVIGREVFWPRPEVDSGLFVIEPRHPLPLREGDGGRGARLGSHPPPRPSPRRRQSGYGASATSRGDGVGPFAEFARFVKALFSQRRKVLRKSVAHAAGTGPEQAEAALAAAGLDPASRVEEATPEAILALFRAAR